MIKTEVYRISGAADLTSGDDGGKMSTYANLLQEEPELKKLEDIKEEKILIPLILDKLRLDPGRYSPLIFLYEKEFLDSRPTRRNCVISNPFNNKEKAIDLLKLWDSGCITLCNSCNKYFYEHESFMNTKPFCIRCYVLLGGKISPSS